MKEKLSTLIYRIANERIQGSGQSLAKVLDEIDTWEADIQKQINGPFTEKPFVNRFTDDLLDKATKKEK